MKFKKLNSVYFLTSLLFFFYKKQDFVLYGYEFLIISSVEGETWDKRCGSAERCWIHEQNMLVTK